MRRLILTLALLALPAAAQAQIAATFLQIAEDATSGTTFTFTSQNLGAAASDRYITVVTLGRKTGTANCNTPPTVSVGGVSASYIIDRGNSVTNCNYGAIHKALVPTGTTGDVVVTWPATYLRTHIALYRSTGGQTAGTPADTGSSVNNDPSDSMTIPANGYAVGGSITTSAGASATWTGLTEQFDAAMTGGSTSNGTGAILTPGTLQSGITITVDWTASGESVGVFASWAPVASGTTPPSNLTIGVGR